MSLAVVRVLTTRFLRHVDRGVMVKMGGWGEDALMAISLTTFRLRGMEALPVDLEVDVGPGMPLFSIVGMAGTSVQEAKDRVRSAMVGSGFRFPLTRKIVNLAPAEAPKSGSHFDLPMALGLLMASKQVPEPAERIFVFGELGLDGAVRASRGVIAALMLARSLGFSRVLLPAENLREARLVSGLKLSGVECLTEAVRALQEPDFEEGTVDASASCMETSIEENCGVATHGALVDFADISGHRAAKRALLVAAAGAHHIALFGPPGSGKSLLAAAFPSILPPLRGEELLEVLRIHGVVSTQTVHDLNRPFRSVHPRMTPFMLLGGGTNLSPGEVSLAHRGVLYMDEFAEFPRPVLESLRGPLEGQALHLRAGKEIAVLPCRFQLLAAFNPCPCGYRGDGEKNCVCSAADLSRYERKLSGPIVDRLDLQVQVPRLAYDDFKLGDLESSAVLRKRVVEARERQRTRLKSEGLFVNQELTPRLLKQERLDLASDAFLSQATRSYSLSGRGVHRLIKVARTLADLAGEEWIRQEHLVEALQYRLRNN